MNKLLFISFVITCCLFGFSHSSSVCTNKTSVTASASATTLNLAIDSSYSATYNYYFTTGNTVEVSVCGDASISPFVGLSTDASSATVTVSQTGPTTQGPIPPTTTPTPEGPAKGVQPSSAGRAGFSPLAAVMSICLACIFAFPKQRFSLAVVFVVLALAFCAPVSQAQSAQGSNAIVINVGIPTTFTSICFSGQNCQTLPTFPYVVSLNNKAFSTVDQASSCTPNQPMKMPVGWALAPYSGEASLVIAFNTWTASVILVQGGSAYVNNQYQSTTSGSFTYDSGANTVTVADCSQKVLIAPTVDFPLNPQYTLISTVAPTNTVTFQGKDYATADNTAFGTSTRVAQSIAVYIQSGDAWQIAQYTPTAGAAQVAFQSETNSFGSDCVTVSATISGNTQLTSYNTGSLATCGTSDIISVNYNGGTVYGVKRGLSYTTKMLVSRTSAVGTIDSWNTMPIINETYTLSSNGVQYAMLDNAPVSGSSGNGCQGRFFAPPSYGWYYASDAQLDALITDLQTSGKWPNTQCFGNNVNSKSRSGTAGCAGSVLASSGLNKNFAATSQCSRTVIVHAPAASTFTVGLKVALITSNINDPVVALATSMLDARQIPYDVYTTDNTVTSIPQLMSGSNPAYYALVMCESMLLSAPNADLRTQIINYKFTYDVRVVSLNAYPDAGQGVIAIGSKQAYNSNFYLDSSFAANFAEHIDGVVPTSLFEVPTNTSLYNTVTPGYNAVPFLRATALNSSVAVSNDDIIGVLVTNTDGTEELQFFGPLNGNTYAGPVLSNVWISWMTRGLYLGYRRVYFSPQIDDLLLPTQQYGNDSDARRMTGDDMRLQSEYFMNELPKILPQGSYVTLTYGINGWGQLNITAGSSTGDAINPQPGMEDDLADSIQTYYDSFFWESHTFSHKDFTCYPEPDPDNPNAACTGFTTTATINSELQLNNQYFNTMLFKGFGGINAERFSPNCFITPAITGLVSPPSKDNFVNPNSVQAMLNNNYTCVVGDNTRPILIAPNPYDGLYTTVETNGAAGLFIIPRYATEVYYNTYNTYYLEAEYNARYGPNAQAPFKPAFDHNLNTDEIMVREANANFWHMSALRHDPFMFHQCNCMHWPYTAPGDTVQKEWSLVSLWVNAVVKKYVSHMNLPLITVKQQDLQDVYFARRDRNACNIAGTLTVTNGVYDHVTVSGNNTCTPIITGINSCNGAANCKIDSYAQDNTAYITLPSSSKSATINIPAGTQW